MIYFFYIFLSSFFEVVAMILIKKYYLEHLDFGKFNFSVFFKKMFNIYFIMGTCIFIFSVFLFFYTLSKINLVNFFIYFSVSKLIFAFYLSDKFLNEKLSKKKLISLFLLVLSLFMVSYG